MDELQISIIMPCIAFISFAVGVLWNEAGHEVKKEAAENERKRLLQGKR